MSPSLTSRRCHRALHLRPERAGLDAHHGHADQLRAVDADAVEDRRQQRHRDQAAEEARRDHMAHRIDRHHLHGRELIGGAHQADLGAQRGAGAAGEQQRGEHRAEFLDQSERGGHAERRLRTEALQQIVALQSQHHADEQAAEHDDHQRAGAGVVDLLDHQPRPRQRRHALPQHAQQKQRHRAELGQRVSAMRAPTCSDDSRAVVLMRCGARATARSSRAPGSGTAPGRRARRS